MPSVLDIEHGLPTLAQFRRMRDQFALDGYRPRWVALNAKRLILKQTIDDINAELNADNPASNKKHLEEEKKNLSWDYQSICGEIAAIEADAPARKRRLGLIPIADEVESTSFAQSGMLLPSQSER